MSSEVSATGCCFLTFAVYLLADTAYSAILDCSVTTIDVEEGVLKDHSATAEQNQPSQQTSDFGSRRQPSEAASLRERDDARDEDERRNRGEHTEPPAPRLHGVRLSA